MSDTTLSPNMNLIIPTVSTDPGPDWANNINASLSILDQHNHSPGSGVQITQDGILLSASGSELDSLNFNSSNAFGLRSARFISQSAALALGTDIGCLYEVGVDLYYNDGAGNQIRITQGGSVTGSSGTITGLPSGTASAAYSAGTFIFQSATNTAANIDGGSFIYRNATASSKGLTLSPPNAMAADYALVLPTIPGATSIMRLDTSGNMSANLIVDNSTLQITSDIISVKNGGITATQIANGTITGTQLASNINLPGDAVQQNSKNLIASNTNATKGLVIVRGQVSSAGAAVNGEGFSSSRPGTGTYTVTFTTAFGDTPVVVASAETSNVSIVSTVSASTSGVTVQATFSGSAVNTAFTFIAIGQRA